MVLVRVGERAGELVIKSSQLAVQLCSPLGLLLLLPVVVVIEEAALLPLPLTR